MVLLTLGSEEKITASGSVKFTDFGFLGVYLRGFFDPPDGSFPSAVTFSSEII
jgi:hypothetical protein